MNESKGSYKKVEVRWDVVSAGQIQGEDRDSMNKEK